MKKIYITGIAGLLGNNIATALKNKYEISGADLINVKIPNISYDVFNLCDEKELRYHITKCNPDILIHTVAAVNVDRCESDVDYAETLNAKLTKKIADICDELGIKLIYISTDAVFDGKKESLYIEDDIVNPINVYGRTKYEGEEYTSQIRNSLILRTNIYGLNIQNKKSFGEWVVDALNNNEEINMFEDILFSPILVNELARVIDKCIEKNLCGLYHACGTGAISKYEFGIKIKKIFDIKTGKINKSQSDIMNFIAPRAKNMGMSNQKLCSKLKIKINTPEESIEEFYRMYSYVKEKNTHGNTNWQFENIR